MICQGIVVIFGMVICWMCVWVCVMVIVFMVSGNLLRGIVLIW